MDLRFWRKNENLSLQSVSRLLETTIATLSRYEVGKRTSFRQKMVDAILNLTFGEVTACDLYGQTPEVIRAAKDKNPNNKKRKA